MTKDELAVSLKLLSGTFRHSMIPDELNGFWLVFKAVPAADFQAAVERAIGECERFPVPAVLRKFLPRKNPTKYLGARCTFHKNNPDKKAQEFEYTCERCVELCRSTWDTKPRESNRLSQLLKSYSESPTPSLSSPASARTAESQSSSAPDAKRAAKRTERE